MKTLFLFLLLTPVIISASEVFFHKGMRMQGQVHLVNTQEGWASVSAAESDGKHFKVWLKDLDTATRVKIGVASAEEIQQIAEQNAAAQAAAIAAAQIQAAQARETQARIQAAYANSVTTAPQNPAPPSQSRVRTYHQGIPGTWISGDGKTTVSQGIPGTVIIHTRP